MTTIDITYFLLKKFQCNSVIFYDTFLRKVKAYRNIYKFNYKLSHQNQKSLIT